MKWLNELLQKVDKYFSKDEELIIGALILEKQELEKEIKQLNQDVLSWIETADKFKEQYLQELKKVLELEKIKEDELETYWNNKIHSSIIKYNARRNENKPIDVRDFLNKNNENTLIIKGDTNDEIALNALKYVRKNIKYTTIKDVENKGEYWQYANETIKYKSGDCEDGAILMANIMLKSGVPYWRIRVNAGDVKGGGHAYVTYLKEKSNQWYVLDWCYWYKSVGTLWKTAENYFGIWWSFNNKCAFKKEVFDK